MISDAILNALLARRGWAARTQNATRNMLHRKSRRPFIPDTLPLTATRLLSLYQMFTRHRQHSRRIHPRESQRRLLHASENFFRRFERLRSTSQQHRVYSRALLPPPPPPPPPNRFTLLYLPMNVSVHFFARWLEDTPRRPFNLTRGVPGLEELEKRDGVP